MLLLFFCVSISAQQVALQHPLLTSTEQRESVELAVAPELSEQQQDLLVRIEKARERGVKTLILMPRDTRLFLDLPDMIREPLHQRGYFYGMLSPEDYAREQRIIRACTAGICCAITSFLVGCVVVSILHV